MDEWIDCLLEDPDLVELIVKLMEETLEQEVGSQRCVSSLLESSTRLLSCSGGLYRHSQTTLDLCIVEDG